MKINLGPLEYQIMRIIWKQKKASVYSVIEELKEKKDLAYTTVMTVMSRLVCKGILEREKEGKVYFYKPVKSKRSFVRILVKKVIQDCVDKFGDEAVIAFSEEIKKLSK